MISNELILLVHCICVARIYLNGFFCRRNGFFISVQEIKGYAFVSPDFCIAWIYVDRFFQRLEGFFVAVLIHEFVSALCPIFGVVLFGTRILIQLRRFVRYYLGWHILIAVIRPGHDLRVERFQHTPAILAGVDCEMQVVDVTCADMGDVANYRILRDALPF